MSKLYQIGSNQNKQTRTNFREKRILTEGCEDSLDYLKNQSMSSFNKTGR